MTRLLSTVLWIFLLPVFSLSQSQDSDLGLSWGIASPELFYSKEGIDGNSISEKRYGFSQSMTFPLTGYYQNLREKSDARKFEKLS